MKYKTFTIVVRSGDEPAIRERCVAKAKSGKDFAVCGQIQIGLIGNKSDRNRVKKTLSADAAPAGQLPTGVEFMTTPKGGTTQLFHVATPSDQVMHAWWTPVDMLAHVSRFRTIDVTHKKRHVTLRLRGDQTGQTRIRVHIALA